MEREALLEQVNDALESEGRTLTLSEETINGELDDALEGVTDDAQVDETFVGRIVKRLKRMDGNLHKDVSTQVRAYKQAHPAPKTTQTSTKSKDGEGDGNGDEDEDMPTWAKKLNARFDAYEQSQKTAKETEAKNATLKEVKQGLKATFKKGNVEVKDYFLNQAMRDLKLPQLEEGESYDVDDLVSKAEKLYYKHLKEAGLDEKKTVQPRAGQRGGGTGETAADRFFARKGKKEGWKK